MALGIVCAVDDVREDALKTTITLSKDTFRCQALGGKTIIDVS